MKRRKAAATKKPLFSEKNRGRISAVPPRLRRPFYEKRSRPFGRGNGRGRCAVHNGFFEKEPTQTGGLLIPKKMLGTAKTPQKTVFRHKAHEVYSVRPPSPTCTVRRLSCHNLSNLLVSDHSFISFIVTHFFRFVKPFFPFRQKFTFY